MNKKEHWDKIYSSKSQNEVSWTQLHPKSSIELIKNANLDKSANIIDIGGGESYLVDYLLKEGFINLTVLDISEDALSKTKKRLGEKAQFVHWIVADINQFTPLQKYDYWHDRAVFHFLTNKEEISAYVQIAENFITPKGFLSIGTFSTNGPLKCSGLDIKQYDENTLYETFQKQFQKIKCFTEDHRTPFGTIQNFLFCSFKRKEHK